MSWLSVFFSSMAGSFVGCLLFVIGSEMLDRYDRWRESKRENFRGR